MVTGMEHKVMTRRNGFIMGGGVAPVSLLLRAISMAETISTEDSTGRTKVVSVKVKSLNHRAPPSLMDGYMGTTRCRAKNMLMKRGSWTKAGYNIDKGCTPSFSIMLLNSICFS